MCTHESSCIGCRCAKKEEERRERIAELLKMLEPELPSHLFEEVKAELEQLI